jgi:phosphohistidine phosphatase
MDLILWRHAEAESGEPDLGRRLTSKGLKQAARVSNWLEHHLPNTCRIVVSPADRAQQTAMALKRRFKTVEALAPEASVEDVLAVAGWPGASKAVVVVGHQPTLGHVAAHLLAGRKSEWSIRKGALWWFSQRDHDGKSTVVLRAVIGPDFV